MATSSESVRGFHVPPGWTEDALFGGRVVLFQPPRGKGYRTNVDALLLASFAAGSAPPPRSRVAFDLGSGVGAVALALLRLEARMRVVLVEIDEVAAAMARENLEVNRWSDRGEVVVGDVLDVARQHQGHADLVVCNPPYVAPGRGRVRPSELRARVGELGRFVEAARQVAGHRARACFVYPASEFGPLLARLAAEGLHGKRARFVHAAPEAPARVVLVEAQAGRAGGLHVMPPLVEREGDGYTAELRRLLSGP